MALRLGDPAPNFTAETTEGQIDFYDWKGDSWAVLFSHPADYTPVCTTELGYLASIKPEFDKRNTKILAVSVDSLEDHKGWSGDIAETQGAAVNYPIIADQDRKRRRGLRHDPPRRGRHLHGALGLRHRPRQRREAQPHLPQEHGPELRRDPPGHRLAAGHGRRMASRPRPSGTRATRSSSRRRSPPRTPARSTPTSTRRSPTCVTSTSPPRSPRRLIGRTDARAGPCLGASGSGTGEGGGAEGQAGHVAPALGGHAGRGDCRPGRPAPRASSVTTDTTVCSRRSWVPADQVGGLDRQLDRPGLVAGGGRRQHPGQQGLRPVVVGRPPGRR